MDIVPLSTKPRKTSVRRHTTELRLEHMPWNNAPNMDFLEPCLSQGSLTIPRMEKATSSNSIHSDMDTNEEFYDPGGGCSQGGIQQELLELNDSQVANNPQHNKYLSYEQALVEENLYPGTLVSQGSQRRISHASHVITEIVTTERNYVTDLHEIIEGYYTPLASKVGIPVYSITEDTLKTLFGNIEAIKDFNSQLLQHFEENKSADSIGRCFLNEVEKFKLHYSSYCNNYANSVKVLARITKDPGTSRLLKDLQKSLGHMLPLGAFLLKPVQRVLRYPLLLKDLEKHLKPSEDHGLIKEALIEMTKVAEHINSMKKKYEESDVKIQEIQNLMRGTDTPDLTKYGDLVMEDTFRSQSGRFRGSGVRQLYLFERLLLVLKKEDEGYQYKTHLEVKDIQLTENLENKNTFEVRSSSTGQFYTFQATTIQVKKKWVDAIKKLVVESIPHISDKTKQLILGGFPTEQRIVRGLGTNEVKSKTLAGGRMRSQTATVPVKRLPSVSVGPQSSTVGSDHPFSPTKFLVAGLVGGNQLFFPPDTKVSNSVTEEPAAPREVKSDEAPLTATSNDQNAVSYPSSSSAAVDQGAGFQDGHHLHRKNCIRKTSPRHNGHSENTSDNGVSSNSPLKIPTDATSNRSPDNEYSMFEQSSDVSASSPLPDKPLTPGGSLDTEKLFGDMISAPSTSPSLPPFFVPSPSPLHRGLSPNETTPVDSPSQPGAEEAFNDLAPLPPPDDSFIIADDPGVSIDEPIIIPAPPEFSECSQLSESDSGTNQLTASGSMQVIQDVILAMEQHIAQSSEEPSSSEELQVVQPCLQNIATVGVSSEQSILCSSANDSQRTAVAVDPLYTPANPKSDSPDERITYNSYSNEIQIAIAVPCIASSDIDTSTKMDTCRIPSVSQLVQKSSDTTVPYPETTLKTSRLDDTTTSSTKVTPKSSRLDDATTISAEVTPKASRLDDATTISAEVTPKASRLDDAMTISAEVTPKASKLDDTTTISVEVTQDASRLDGSVTPNEGNTPKSSRPLQSKVHQLAREYSKRMRITTQDAEVTQVPSEPSKEHPQWLKRLKQKKGTIGTDSDDSDSSPKPPKQSTKLLRQKSLTLSRFNSNKDIVAQGGSEVTAQNAKENTSVPEKRKALMMGPSPSVDTGSTQVSGKSTTMPKVSSALTSKAMDTKVPSSPIITAALSQGQASSPGATPKTSLQLRITPTKTVPEHNPLSQRTSTSPSQLSNSQDTEFHLSKKGAENKNGSASVTTAEELTLQRKSSKHKSSTFHRLSDAETLTESHSNMQRAVSEANLMQQDPTATEAEPHQRQRFKGWVKSLVDKFSSK